MSKNRRREQVNTLLYHWCKTLGNVSIYVSQHWPWLTTGNCNTLRLQWYSHPSPFSFYSHKHYLVLELNKNGFISFSKALGSNLQEPNLSVLFHPHTWKNSFNFCTPAWLKAIAWNFNSGDFHSQAGGQSWNCSTFLSTSFCHGEAGKK